MQTTAGYTCSCRRPVRLAVTRDRLYRPAPERDAVWVVDRRGGTLLRTVAVGRGPVGIAAGAP